MSLNDTFKRLETLDHYIRTRNTGSRAQLAVKMRISVSTLQDYINFMKDSLNAPIEYDYLHRTYFYMDDGELDFNFRSKPKRAIEKDTYRYIRESALKNWRG